MAEIDDGELQELRNAQDLVRKLTTNPKSKRFFEKGVKEINPEFQTEEDIAKPFVDPIQARLDEIDKVVKTRFQKMDEDAIDSKISERFSELRKVHGYTDEGIDNVKKIMVERKIPDVDAAVALFEKQNKPKAEPLPGLTPSSWGFGSNSGDEYFDKLMAGDRGAVEHEASRVWNEIINGKNPGDL